MATKTPEGSEVRTTGYTLRCGQGIRVAGVIVILESCHQGARIKVTAPRSESIERLKRPER